MAQFKRVEDKWKHLRKDLYGNVEPEVTLEAITMPVYKHGGGSYSAHESISYGGAQEMHIDWKQVEMMPALAASTSYNSKEKLEGNYEKCCALNRNLIKQRHLTPFECVQYQLKVEGLSKAAGAQFSRYRHSGHISKSRRFVYQEPAFIYPMLDYIDLEWEARERFKHYSLHNESSIRLYEWMRKDKIITGVKGTFDEEGQMIYEDDTFVPSTPLKKEDARGIIPVFSSTARTMWVNVRSLRHIFDERLRADTESELRRLMWMIWDLVEPLCPSFYFDLKEEMGI